MVTVTRQGSFETPPLTELVNNHIFSGEENDIVTSQDYTTRFICSFNMQYYPFDKQECQMKFMLTVCYLVFVLTKSIELSENLLPTGISQ